MTSALFDRVFVLRLLFSRLNEILQSADDLLVDIPRFWFYMGEIIAPMIHNDKSSLLFLVDIARSLVDRDLAGELLAKVLHASSVTLVSGFSFLLLLYF